MADISIAGAAKVNYKTTDFDSATVRDTNLFTNEADIKIIENSEGDRTTPSIIAFPKDSEEVLVGQSAKRQAVTNPENTLYAIKRLIGRRFEEDAVQKDSILCLIKLLKLTMAMLGLKLTALKWQHQISAKVIGKMKKTADDYLGETVTDAVITVPAYCN
jgi:molecular chaperone DnaK